jgi:glycosyltransferase involved in cell wall biosynthesis
MRPSHNTATPKVSVIIPSYKTADLILACLDSVFAQTFTDFEAIVVNDGSPDTPELEKVIQPYADRIVYIKQENKRAAAARNTAIRHARGDYLAFLDSDDAWLPDHLASQMALFAADPSIGLTYANAFLVGDPRREIPFTELCPSHGEATFEALIEERCQVPISTVVVRKEAVVNVGMFNEKLPRCDDYDLWVRIAFNGYKIGYTSTVQARLFIGRPGSLGAMRVKMAEAYLNMLEQFQRTLPLNDAQRSVVANRAVYAKALYMLEEGKCRLEARQYKQAKELITGANAYYRRSALSLTVLGLNLVPGATSKLVSFILRKRNGALA